MGGRSQERALPGGSACSQSEFPQLSLTELSERGLWGLVTGRWKELERETFHCKSPDQPALLGFVTEHNVTVSEDSSGVTVLKPQMPIMERDLMRIEKRGLSQPDRF